MNRKFSKVLGLWFKVEVSCRVVWSMTYRGRYKADVLARPIG